MSEQSTKRKVYRTTAGSVSPEYFNDHADPEPPDGYGWQMCGSAVNDGVAYWFWCRWEPEEDAS